MRLIKACRINFMLIVIIIPVSELTKIIIGKTENRNIYEVYEYLVTKKLSNSNMSNAKKINFFHMKQIISDRCECSRVFLFLEK